MFLDFRLLTRPLKEPNRLFFLDREGKKGCEGELVSFLVAILIYVDLVMCWVVLCYVGTVMYCTELYCTLGGVCYEMNEVKVYLVGPTFWRSIIVFVCNAMPV